MVCNHINYINYLHFQIHPGNLYELFVKHNLPLETMFFYALLNTQIRQCQANYIFSELVPQYVGIKSKTGWQLCKMTSTPTIMISFFTMEVNPFMFDFLSYWLLITDYREGWIRQNTKICILLCVLCVLTV